MAEIVAAALLNAVFEKLADEALKKLVRSQGIHSEVKKLERTLSQIQALINDASQKEINDESVKQWLNSLQHLAYDIDDILDDLATEAMRCEITEESRGVYSKVRKLLPTCCTSTLISNRLCNKLDDVTTKLEDLVKEKTSLGLIVKDESPKNMSRRNETSLLDASSIVRRDADKEKLLRMLLVDDPCDQKFSIVPIVGMGGIGKTTLARLLYNETQVKGHFELKAWVCVSDEFDIFKISKTMFQAMTRESKEFEDLNQLQMAIIEQLKDKRFLLVLDDVWSENYGDWEILVRPFHLGAYGSKVIMTTRKERLLKKLGWDHLDHLKSLSHDDAMCLFAQHALGVDTFDSHPTLRPLAEGIVKKCGGLPLASRVLGRLLRTKTNEEDWDDVLNSVIWSLESVDEIVPALRLSYHDLPACLKRLFAYCSLFPKDFLFDKEELVLLWMSERFLNQTTTNKLPEYLGHEYFEMLLSRSFFQLAPNEESLFVMHDLMNDLATFVAGDSFLRLDNQMEMKKEILAKYRHMSFIPEKYVAYHKLETLKGVKSLRTLLAPSVGVKQRIGHFYLSSKILVDILPGLSLLRVLCLSCFQISEVPKFIGCLRHLRYLNLSQTQIKELPENMGNLYNLQTLIVFGCWGLTKLPKSLLRLRNLRHFDIRDTPLLKKTPIMIGSLKSLQTFTKIIIGDGLKISELKELKNLHGKTSIKGLDKVQTVMHAREANLSLKKLTELELEWDDVVGSFRNETLEKEVLNVLNPHSNKLRKLEIFSYGGIEFPDWVGDPSFCKLAHVSIRNCRKCTSLPALGQLPLLKKLVIRGMDGIEVVGSELLGNNSVTFPSLEILSFGDMQSWEVWSTSNGGAHGVFPCLQELYIRCCPNLVEVSLETLPTLRVLIVVGCGYGVVRSLVHAAFKITRLEIEYISGLTDEKWLGVLDHLEVVEELRIQDCNELRYLWKTKANTSNILTSLKKLQVSYCSNMVRLGEKDDDNNGSSPLTCLKILEVQNCTSMVTCSCPSSLERLTLYDCASLTSVSFPTRHNLKSLTIYNCNQVMNKVFGVTETTNHQNMSTLEYVNIRCMPNLKSIIELSHSIHLTNLIIQDCQSMRSFPQLKLPNLIQLIIEDCPNMESFPDIQLPNLTSLKDLVIKNCSCMDASFSRALWPPKLCSLEIGGLKTCVSKWGLQNYPNSLVKLQLFGKHSGNSHQLPHVLPSSLTSLGINNFEKLESLSMGLQHLTSLRHLDINNCPEMTHLPTMLLPSLLSLKICECPKLKERSSRSNSYYWPLISHIPCIYIDWELQN